MFYLCASVIFRSMACPFLCASVTCLTRRYEFFLVPVPVTLLPKVGWVFYRLECQIVLNPD